MDYKLLIILLVLLFLIILVYREVSNFKDEMINNMANLGIDLEQRSNRMVTKLQNNMIKCVSQIKGISSDNLNQLRKITLLNNQPITRIANHFTETDDSEIHTDINYFSDTRNRFNMTDNLSNTLSGAENKRQIFHLRSPSNNGEFYMSESDDPESSDGSEFISGTNEKSSKANGSEANKSNNSKELVCDNDVCYLVDKDNKNNENNEDDIPIYVSKNEEGTDLEIPQYKSEYNGQVEQNIEKRESEIPIYGSSRYTNENHLIDDESNSNDSDNYYDKNDDGNNSDGNGGNDGNGYNDTKVDLVPVGEKKEKDNLENSFIDDDPEDYSDEGEDLDIAKYDISMRENPGDNSEIEVDIYNMISGSNMLPNLPMGVMSTMVPKFDQESDDYRNYQNFDDIYVEEVSNSKEDCDTESVDAEKKVSKIDMSESLKNILSSSREKGINSSDANSSGSSSGSSDNDDSAVDNASATDNDNASVDSSIGNSKSKRREGTNDSNIMKILENNLGAISSYNVKDLRKIAQSLSLPVSYKNQNKWKMYRKEELYKKIKKHIRERN